MAVANYSGTIANPVGGFLNSNGVLTNPTTVVVTVTDPTGVVTTPAPVNDATGLYHANVDTTGKPGVWKYVWTGSGVIQAIAENAFRVTPLL